MATRLYTSHKLPGVRIDGPLRGAWAVMGADGATHGFIQETFLIQRTKGEDTLPVVKFDYRTNQQGNFDFAKLMRFTTYPLQAQNISGNFNFCFGIRCFWDTTDAILFSAVVKWKVHVYLADGQTSKVKTVLLDNYVNPTAFQNPGGGYDFTWTGLDVSQPLNAATVAAGDIIVIELGFRVVSSPTPVPTYPPTHSTKLEFYHLGSNAANPDATRGLIYGGRVPNENGWFEFSMDLLELPLPAPAANDSCVDAIVIPTLPYTSPFIDSTRSTDQWKGVWWTFVAPKTGSICLMAHGSNYESYIEVYTGICGALAFATTIGGSGSITSHRSHATTMLQAEEGIQYFVKIRTYLSHVRASAGVTRLSVFYRETPERDDLYIAGPSLMAYRDGQCVNVSNAFSSYGAITGLGIDYTKRPMYNLDDDTIHTDYRLCVALHAYELVEIIDLATLSIGVGEIDFIGGIWWDVPVSIHPAQLHVTRNGIVHASWFGNGYRYVAGVGTQYPASLDSISSVAQYSSLKSVDLLKADNQPGNPFPTDTDTERILNVQSTAPWAIVFNEITGILYYNSGGLYVPTIPSNVIKRYDIVNNVQLTDFATVPLQPTRNPGLKGMDLLPDGGLLVCNGNVVNRLNASGVVTQTYTPSIPEECQVLVDVKLSVDKTKFWVIDLWSTRIWQFNVATGAEIKTFQPYLNSGAVLQMAVFDPDGLTPEPPPEEISGLYYVNPNKIAYHDSYYNDVEKKIPNPTIRTSLIGE